MAKRKDDDQVTCERCKKAIFGVELKYVVRLSNGFMHGTCHKEQTAIVQRLITTALAAGTHSETSTFVCRICGGLVDAIYHRTFDGKDACRACAVRMGVKFQAPAGAVA
jgi:hypothetical protein